MKVALLITDNREDFRNYSAPTPGFDAAPEALIEGFAALPELEVHVISCAQKPMKSPEKLSDNIWFHSLYVPKTGWLRTSYQGCIRAVRRRLKAIKADLVHGLGTEHECAISAAFSRFPNVVTVHDNMAELARLSRAPMASPAWLAAQLEDATLKRAGGVLCNSEYTENLVRPHSATTWRVPEPLRQVFFDMPLAKPPPDKCILINAGMIGERQRQLELINVAHRLQEQGLKLELQFVGHANPEDPYAVKYLERIRQAEAHGYARQLGTKSTAELIALFDGAHGLVHFPREAAFELVVAEAMSRNLAFFGSRLGGLVDLCNGVPGAKLLAPEDWDGLTLDLANWIQAGHPKASGAGMMRARHHPGVIARRHLEIYREVLSKPA